MNLLFIASNYSPESNAGSQRARSCAEHWARHPVVETVTVMTSVPNFPTGKIYPGFVNTFIPQSSIHENVNLIRCWTFLAENKGIMRRSFSFLSFFISSIASSLCLKNKPHVVIGSSPHPMAAFAGLVIARLYRAKYVVEVRDFWPESLEAVGIQNIVLTGVLRLVAKVMYSQADGIVVVTDRSKDFLIDRYAPKCPVEVFMNGYDDVTYGTNVKRKSNPKFVIGYIGTVGAAHQVEILLNSYDRACKDSEVFSKNSELLIVGTGAEIEEIKIIQEHLNNPSIKIIGSVGYTEIPKFYQTLSISCTHLKPNKIFEDVIPSKIFESIGFGVPVINTIPGASAEYLSASACGIQAIWADVENISEVMIWLFENKNLYKNLTKNCLAERQNILRSNINTAYLNWIIKAI